MADLLSRLRRTEHRFCQDNLSSYIDGQLPERARERVQRHLQGCQECRWDLETLERTVALLRAMPRPKPPRSFTIPETAPAPSVPFWMRPGVYATLRTATATVAALFVITVVGNVLTLPAFGGARTMRAPDLTFGKAEAPVAAPVAQGGEEPATEGLAAPMLGAGAATPTPAPASAMAAATVSPPPTGEPTLTAEEAARKAGAPPGKGGGELTPPTPQPVGTPDGRSAATAVPAPAMPAPQAMVAPSGAPALTATPAEVARALGIEQGEPTARAGETMGLDRGQAAATAAADTYHLERSAAQDALREVQLRLATYPWPALMMLAAVALAVLLGATLWLRSARSRWP